MQPALTTSRLELRPAAPSDVDVLWRLWSDPHVRRYLWDDREIARDEAEATLADALPLADQGLGLWMVQLTGGPQDAVPAAGAVIGCAGLFPVSTAAEFDARLAGLVEPLVALAPAAWGRGYAREALTALMDHARDTLGLKHLAGVTDVPNAASDRMLRHAGFDLLGEVDGPRYRLRTYLWAAGGAHSA